IKKQKYYLWIMLSGALFNLSLNFVMIPALGLRGAALATVITEGMIMVLSGAVVLQTFRHPHEGGDLSIN
ncbi:polysaccharide biosynthesis C-terminal domain-containing protein, partial [bacterium]|nr:polysaccharide biosynthesis C-terminal domain-containing protein [bacterium]